ncbi:MAG: STAS domain-containing protein [Kibdelosporangium sp.]
MTTPLTLTPTRDAEGTVVLKAGGEIDMTNCEDFAAAIEDVPDRLVVDLTDVEYMDSAGLSVLFTYADRIEVVVPSLLAPVVTFSGLAAVTTVHEVGAP